MTFSLVTLVKGRYQQLNNLLEAVSDSTRVPQEIIVVKMDDEAWQAPSNLNLQVDTLTMNEQGLPLAKARNKGMAAATQENVVFLDIDCICSPTLFENLLSALSAQVVVSARARYLSHLPNHGNYARLFDDSVAHPKRQALPGNTAVCYKHFWSLVFAIRKSTFRRVGGFDEAFCGYGAEDTDFARRFDAVAVSLIFIDDDILHQYHTKYSPPVNYTEDICANANLFKQKHGFFPMYGWLKTFEKMGLVAFSYDEEQVNFMRNATAKEKQACLSTSPY